MLHSANLVKNLPPLSSLEGTAVRPLSPRPRGTLAAAKEQPCDRAMKVLPGRVLLEKCRHHEVRITRDVVADPKCQRTKDEGTSTQDQLRITMELPPSIAPADISGDDVLKKELGKIAQHFLALPCTCLRIRPGNRAHVARSQSA